MSNQSEEALRLSRELLTALVADKVKRPKLCQVVFGDSSKRTVDALIAYQRGTSSRGDITAKLYEKLPVIFNLTTNPEVRRIIMALRSDDDVPGYANELRRVYNVDMEDLAKAGDLWAGSYTAYRHDPKTALVFKSTLNVEAYNPMEKSIKYTHIRHDSNVYVVNGFLIPTKNTFCFFGRSYREKEEEPHGGVITIFVNRPSKSDQAIWDHQGVALRQGIMMISLPDETHPAFATRVVFLKHDEFNERLNFRKPWTEPKDIRFAENEIDGAMRAPEDGPDGSIARNLLSNRVLADQDCLMSYKQPVP